MIDVADPPIRVLIVDDHPVVRRGLASFLGNEPDLEVVGAAVDGEEALKLADGIVKISPVLDDDSGDLLFSDKFACITCGVSYPEITPRMFSFNNPQGACPTSGRRCQCAGPRLRAAESRAARPLCD